MDYVEQMIPGLRHCVYKLTEILCPTGAKPFLMGASCQAMKNDIPHTLFSLASTMDQLTPHVRQ